jgi:hypothetical protein
MRAIPGMGSIPPPRDHQQKLVGKLRGTGSQTLGAICQIT